MPIIAIAYNRLDYHYHHDWRKAGTDVFGRLVGGDVMAKCDVVYCRTIIMRGPKSTFAIGDGECPCGWYFCSPHKALYTQIYGDKG